MTAPRVWLAIAAVVVASVVGDILIARAMRSIGHVAEVRQRDGLFGLLRRMLTSPALLAGIACMAAAFFSLLVALSWADVSLVAPATASLTFIGTTLAAGFFLGENVDARRWVAALLVAAGVVLLAL